MSSHEFNLILMCFDMRPSIGYYKLPRIHPPWEMNLSFLLRGGRGIPEIHAIQEKRENWQLELEAQKRVS